MKKFYTLVLSLSFIVPATATTGMPLSKLTDKVKTKIAVTAKKRMHKAAANQLWRPGSMTDYIYEDGEWVMLGSTALTYDNRGNVLTETNTDEEGYQTKVQRTYDANNNVLTYLQMVNDGDGWINDEKRQYVYDQIVTDFVIERMGYTWEDDEWVSNYYCEKNVITRNSVGSITEIIKQVPLYGQLTDAYRSVWGYDQATGKANVFQYYTADGTGTWSLDDDMEYRDIEWVATDGQMTKSDLMEYVEGANLLKKATIYSEGEALDRVEAEYTDKAGEYLIKIIFDFPGVTAVIATKEKKFIDDNGSFTVTINEYVDYDSGTVSATPTYTSCQTVLYDDKGNIIAETAKEMLPDEPEFIMGAKYDYTYDDNGNVTEMITSMYDSDEDIYINDMRTVYADYTNVANGSDGVSDITVTETGSAVYYNLQGVRVAHPQPGCMYIRIADGKADKVIL